MQMPVLEIKPEVEITCTDITLEITAVERPAGVKDELCSVVQWNEDDYPFPLSQV